MSMNSVNTNIGSQVALQSLNRTSDQLSVVQKRISTGMRVADAKDDGGAFAVAQSVRGDVAGLTAANEQLGGLKGIVDVTLNGLGQVSKTMVEVRTVLTRLADGTINDEQRDQYEQQYDQLRTQIERFIDDATYRSGLNIYRERRKTIFVKQFKHCAPQRKEVATMVYTSNIEKLLYR